MKTYYLRLVKDDFVETDTASYLSGVVDLYDNESSESEVATPSYRNYSVKRSLYGMDPIGDLTYTGLEVDGYPSATPATTDIGEIWYDRFIDHSGRIDVTEWIVNLDGQPGTADIDYALSVYHIDDLDLEFPEEWAGQFDVPSNRSISIFKAFRYARFKLDITSLQSVADCDFELLVKINIGEPVEAPFYQATQKILDRFPEWMELREILNRNQDHPEVATPESVGAALINSVSGEWVESLKQQNTWVSLQRYLGTASIDQMDWVWRTDEVPAQVVKVQGDGVELARVETFSDFWATNIEDDVFFWVRETRTIYTRKVYADLKVNWATYDQAGHKVWNYFDEFGLMLDLPRHFLEDNETYRARLFDVHINKPGVGVDAFKLALRRELNLWKAFGFTPVYSATPVSDYAGATPTVLSIEDIEDHLDYVDPDGMPTSKFISLVEEISELYPTTWGYIKFNEALWDPGGVEGEGYNVLPYRYDATPLSQDATPMIQAGVGDGNDLFIYRPDTVTGPRDFTAKIKVRGRHLVQRTEYVRMLAVIELYGTADRDIYDNPEVSEWFTVRVVTNDATPQTYYHTFELTATSDADISTSGLPTDASFVNYMFLDATGQPLEGETWYHSSGTTHVIESDEIDDDGIVTNALFDGSELTEIRAYPGRWDPNTSSLVDVPGSDTFDLWFAEDDSTVLDYNDTFIEADSISSYVVMKPLPTSVSTGTWTSEPVTYYIPLNGVAPDETILNYTLPAPDITWDPYIDGGTEEYVIRAETSDLTRVGVGIYPNDNTFKFIDSSYLHVNGSNTWTSGTQTFNYAATSNFVFSSGTGADYPIVNAPIWELFEEDQLVSFEGVVDENGPWRNGLPQPKGNNNYHLKTLELDRADFGIPETEEYIITWMGVELVQGGRVVVWLDTNTVHPAVDDGTNITYPDTAIEETYSDDTMTYSFSPIFVKARMELGASPSWNPQIHAGWFYEGDEEYYLYARGREETATENNWPLTYVSRQGAPIIVKDEDGNEYRQVAFYDPATPWDGTDSDTILVARQRVYGTDTENLYLAYENVYDVSVRDLTLGLNIPCDSETLTNVLPMLTTTDRDHEYEVSYKVMNSFFADNEWVDDSGNNRTRLMFSENPSGDLTVNYESSRFDPATPIDIPLNTFYTIQSKAYVFISHDEYDFASADIRVSPSTLVADGEDVLMVSVFTKDTYGNPKPNEAVTLSTTWGTLDNTSLVTDMDGFATAILTAAASTTETIGTISVTIASLPVAEIDFNIIPSKENGYRLVAVPGADQIPADGRAVQWVFGKLEDDDLSPVPNALVHWRKGRYMYEVFEEDWSTNTSAPGAYGVAGMVTTDSDGRFLVGPFIAATPNDPGFWFVSLESFETAPYHATPEWDMVGDVVSWLEYFPSQYGQDVGSGVPIPTIQMATPAYVHPHFWSENEFTFPTLWDEDNWVGPATPTTPVIPMPPWWGVNRYVQYQQGVLGLDRYEVDISELPNAWPDYKEY